MLRLVTVEKFAPIDLPPPLRPEEIDPSWSFSKIAEETVPRDWLPAFQGARDELETVNQLIEGRKGCLERPEDISDGKAHLSTAFRGPFNPSKEEMFRAFYLTPLREVRVVIVGQDPYPGTLPCGRSEACGLAFSGRPDYPVPSSLRNVFAELTEDVPGFVPPASGDLTKWALQGVLLLNLALTVRPGVPNSHQGIWLGVVKKIVTAVTQHRPKTIFLLWGQEAQKVTDFLGERAIVLEAAHPSSRNQRGGFLGCKHFSQVNRHLASMGERIIDWTL